MSAQLGIGVRVWVKFNPKIREGRRCRTGTIVEGPFDAGTVFEEPVSGQIFRLAETAWAVRLDGDDYPHPDCFQESDLTPLDDGDPAAERERADRGEEVGA